MRDDIIFSLLCLFFVFLSEITRLFFFMPLLFHERCWYFRYIVPWFSLWLIMSRWWIPLFRLYSLRRFWAFRLLVFIIWYYTILLPAFQKSPFCFSFSFLRWHDEGYICFLFLFWAFIEIFFFEASSFHYRYLMLPFATISPPGVAVIFTPPLWYYMSCWALLMPDAIFFFIQSALSSFSIRHILSRFSFTAYSSFRLSEVEITTYIHIILLSRLFISFCAPYSERYYTWSRKEPFSFSLLMIMLIFPSCHFSLFFRHILFHFLFLYFPIHISLRRCSLLFIDGYAIKIYTESAFRLPHASHNITLYTIWQFFWLLSDALPSYYSSPAFAIATDIHIYIDALLFFDIACQAITWRRYASSSFTDIYHFPRTFSFPRRFSWYHDDAFSLFCLILRRWCFSMPHIYQRIGCFDDNVALFFFSFHASAQHCFTMPFYHICWLLCPFPPLFSCCCFWYYMLLDDYCRCSLRPTSSPILPILSFVEPAAIYRRHAHYALFIFLLLRYGVIIAADYYAMIRLPSSPSFFWLFFLFRLPFPTMIFYTREFTGGGREQRLLPFQISFLSHFRRLFTR